MTRIVMILCLLLSIISVDARQKMGNGKEADATSFAPFPKASDKYWRKQVPEVMRRDYILLGESYMNKPWEAIPDEVFAEFRTYGNRTHYEALSFGIRKQLACLVMAEIMQGKGRFLSDICHGLHYFMEKEPWWGIPAHYPKAKPERGIQPVDLFNAETSDMLAWTLYMLGEQIDKKEKGLCDSVRHEIERRFLHPTLYEKQGWKHNANNWNTWITANWLQTVLICEQDGRGAKEEAKSLNADRKAAFEGVKECLLTFLKGYPDDGGCEEGVSYWDCAGASFFESLFFMQYAPREARLQLDDAQRKKVEAMGRFITTMYIDSLNFVNFSDAQAHNIPNINILFPYGEYIGDEPMMQLAAYVGKTFDYLEKPSTLFLRSGNFPKLGRELMLLSMLGKYQATAAVQPKTTDVYLENSQIMVASSLNWLVAAKGGHNAESHNHNDIGNFVIYHNRQPVIIDLGRDTYTSQSFSNRRFELMNCRSAYHNVPLINGYEQKDGRQYRAEKVSYVSTAQLSSFSLDLARAYPEAAGVDAWNRTITLDRVRNSVEVTEVCQAINSQLVLIVNGKPKLLMKDTASGNCQSGRILLQDGSVCLEYDAEQLSASIEKIQMSDGIMKTQWKDNVYRIVLRLHSDRLDTKMKYRFVEK